MSELENRIDSLLNGKKATVGIAVWTDKGDMLRYNDHVHFPLLSVFKFHVALAVLDKMDKQSISLDSIVSIKASQMLPNTYSPLRKKFPDQDFTITLRELMQYSISQSDNNACDILFRVFGGPAATDEYLRSMGLRDFAIEVTEDDMHRNLADCYRNWTTPLEAVRLLEWLVSGKAAKGAYRDFIEQTMISCQTGRDRLPAPLDATVLFELGGIDRPDLKYRPFIPTTNRQIAEVESSRAQDIFAAIRERDILLHHPYDSFSTSVQAFLAQAAADPKVLAIKQTLYRTSSNSPIIDALIDAAHAGKQVLALVEIKARFDEDANIAWARKLERAGVHVVYGIVGLKTHCKLSLVVRQEADGLRRYCHVGTGNYNPKTARIYTDLGLLTCDPVVGQDMTRLFNQLSGYAPKSSFHRLLVAPRTVRSGLIQRIRREEDAARAGKEAWIKIKVNSIVDEKTIDALYRASQAGVKIDIVERGICALKPGVPGLSENIRVRSILGRFLEHSRIYAFANSDGPQIGEGPAAGPEVWIGSADLMHRNLDRRVEALVRIVAPEQIDELIEYVDLQMADSTASWHMQADGTYVRHCKDEEGRPLVDSQEYLIKKHTRRPVRH